MAQQRIGRYEVLEELGVGGFATVHRARDPGMDRIIALKVMHPHLARDPQYLERFLREARAAGAVNHPNVVIVYEVGSDGEQHYIAMEYLPSSLHDLLGQRGALQAEEALALLRPIALALQAAHERGIVHRDIKPHNILLTEEGVPKVTDFGIARAADLGTMTRTGMVMGTPQYMSPEQGRGERVDIRSDIYSLGIVLYQMLTGTTPLEGSTPQEVMRHHLQERDTPMGTLAGLRLPSGVAGLLERCLEKDPDRRYQTPGELARALERAMPGAEHPQEAERPAVPPRPPSPRPPATALPVATSSAPAPTAITTPSPAPTPTTTPVATAIPLFTLTGHGGSVGSVAFSPDGSTLASGSYDETIKLWDVARGTELRTLHGHSDWVWSVAFSPDGSTLASGSFDHTVKLWDVAGDAP